MHVRIFPSHHGIPMYMQLKKKTINSNNDNKKKLNVKRSN